MNIFFCLHFVSFIRVTPLPDCFIFEPLLNKSQSEQGHCSLPSSSQTTTDSNRFIDGLLQDAFLFVVDVKHDNALVRDEAFYRRGCELVEQISERLSVMKMDAEITDHIRYALCGLLDMSVLNTASADENSIWQGTPLEGRYFGTLQAGEFLPERLRKLLHQPTPDMRLLVLYQRIYAMGFGLHLPAYADERRRAMVSLDARVRDNNERPQPPMRVDVPFHRLRFSRWLVIPLSLAGAVLLWCVLSFSLSHLLHTALPG